MVCNIRRDDTKIIVATVERCVKMTFVSSEHMFIIFDDRKQLFFCEESLMLFLSCMI